MKIIFFAFNMLTLILFISACGLSGGKTLKSPTGKSLVTTTQAQNRTTPTLSSDITISTPSLSNTNSGPVNYTITFARDSDADLLALSSIKLLTTDAITASTEISGSGLQRLVTLTSIAGEGSFRLSITLLKETFSSAIADTVIIDKTAPIVLNSNWTMSNPASGLTSSSVTPLVSAENLNLNLNSADEGESVSLYDADTCAEANLVGSATISSGNVTFSNISYASTITNRTIHFYAIITDLALNESSCSDLELSYYLDLIVTPGAPSGIHLTSPSNGTTSNNVIPIIAKSGLSELGDDVVVAIYDSSSCELMKGSATISTSGSFTVSNIIAYLNDGSADGIKTFYGTYSRGPTHTSNCVNLGIGFKLDTTSPTAPAGWNLLTPTNGGTANSSTPEIGGAAISVAEEGSLAVIYGDSSCEESILGGATIISGSFTVSNINYLSNGTEDGAKIYFGKIIDIAGNSSACTALNLGFLYDTTNPVAPSGWTLTTPTNGATSGVLTPIIGGSGLSSENGSVVNIYINSSDCSNAIRGSATISSGNFSITNITFATDGSENGTKAFYGIIGDRAENRSACTNLNSGYLFDSTIPSVAITSPTASNYINVSNKVAFTVSGSCSATGTNNVVITATGGLTSTVNCDAGHTWTTNFNFTSVSDGSITITANHTSVGGVSATPESVTLTKETVSPAPTGALTLPSNRTYIAGENIDFSLPIDSNNITVNTAGGTPYIVITIDVTAKNANYISTTGGNILNFRYTVESGLLDTNGIAIATALTLNGGTVKDSAENDLSPLTFTVGNLASVLVDSTPPTFTGTAGIPASASYKTGTNLDFTLATSEAVTVSGGSPTIALNIGGTTKQATYVDADGAAGHTGTSLRFRYTIESGLNDTNGIGVDTAIVALNGATIKDATTNNLTPLTFAIGVTTGIIVDTTNPSAPSGWSMQSPASGATSSDTTPQIIGAGLTAEIGGTVSIYDTFPCVVPVGSIAITGDDFTVSNIIYETDHSDDGTLSFYGTVTDIAGNVVAPCTNLILNYLFDTTSPAPTGALTLPANGTYISTNNIDIALPINSNVTVNTAGGTPYIALTIGATPKNASYLSTTGGNTLNFRYTVESGLSDTDGITIDTAVTLNGGTIKDIASNDLTPLTYTVGSTTSVLIDSTAPAPTGALTLPGNGTYVSESNIDLIVPVSENVTVNTAGGTPTIALTISGTGKSAIYLDANGSGGNTGSSLRFRYTVEAGLTDNDGITIATAMVLNGGTILDSATNALTPLTFTVGDATSILVNSVVPYATGSASIPGSQTYDLGDQLNFTITANEPVTANTAGGTPRLTLNIGGTTKYATFVNTSGADINFRYTVEAGLSDADGISVSNTISLNGGTITNAAGNGFSPLTFTVGDTSGILIDSTTLATHGGWVDLFAIGPKTKTDASGNEITVNEAGYTNTVCGGTVNCIKLTWGDFTRGGDTISSYNIYRATTAGGQDFNSPLATGITTVNKYYIDTATTPGTTYYYVVRPVISGAVILTTEDYSEIRVIAPPNNMALTHRSIANQEICGLLARATDATHNYRCLFNGFGGNGTYYDLGNDLLVDRFETGCNFSRSAACASHSDGATANVTDCIGDDIPSTEVGNPINTAIANVYYDRNNVKCYIWKAGASSWSEIQTLSDTTEMVTSTASPGTGIGSIYASSRAHLPPLTFVGQNECYYSLLSQSGISIGGSTYYKRSLSKREWHAMSAWSSSVADIGTMESGASVATDDCNANSGGGNLPNLDLSDDKFPGSDGSSLAFRTGSDSVTSTRACVSRYGAQDAVGNVNEWVSDQINEGVGIASPYDATNTIFNGFDFIANQQGPNTGSAAVSTYPYASSTMGIPLRCTNVAPGDPAPRCETDDKLVAPATNGDFFYLNTTSSRGGIVGGTWSNGSNCGRFYWYLNGASSLRSGLAGCRGGFPVTGDTVAPYAMSSVTLPSNKAYTLSDQLTFTIPISEIVTVNTAGGTPYITLNIGGTTVLATYVDADGAGGHTGNLLRFRYTISDTSLSDADGLAIANSNLMTLNGGTITDSGTNTLSPLSFSPGTTVGVTVYTPPAVHGGWVDVFAIGPKTKTDTDDSELTVNEAGYTNTVCGGTANCVRLQWETFTRNADVITSYNIYRATTSGGQDFSTPLAVGITTANKYYIDTAIVPGTVYYYVVRPIIGGVPYYTAENYSEIKVIAPPNNMALTHRWIANQEICGLLGRATDATNNYRCLFNGFGGDGTHYDLGYDLLVDRFETGCNFNRNAACASHSDGTTANVTDCIGSGTPSTQVGNPNNTAIANVYYDRTNVKCYIWKAGASSWSEVQTLNATTEMVTSTASPGTGIGKTYASSRAHLPPLAYIAQNECYYSLLSQTGISIGGSTYYKRSLSKREWHAMSAWSSSVADIGTMESGASAATDDCNTNSVGGNLANLDLSDDKFPGSTTNSRAFRTGSDSATSTRTCVSRYGAQDAVGNLYEWVSDQINAGVGITSPYDATNTTFNGFDFISNQQGPNTGSAAVSTYPYVSSTMGIPLQCTNVAPGDPAPRCQTDDKLAAPATNGNYFYLTTTSSRGVLMSGAWNAGFPGRFNSHFNMVPSSRFEYLGCRGGLPVPTP